MTDEERARAHRSCSADHQSDDGQRVLREPHAFDRHAPEGGRTERNWFDEFAVDPTTGVALAFPDVEAGLGYLGQPTGPAWPSALANGVYTRRFHKDTTGSSWLVLLNPKGNGVQTVKLAQPMKNP